MTVAWLTYVSKHLHTGDVVEAKLFQRSCGGSDEGCIPADAIQAFAINYENSRIPADVVAGDGCFDISFVTDVEGFYTIAAQGVVQGAAKGAAGTTHFFAKTALSVGHGPRDYNQTTDFELDITPLRVGRYYSGETISLMVSYKGVPLAGVDVKAMTIDIGADDWADEADRADTDLSAVTGDDGVAGIEIPTHGDWVFYAAAEMDGKKLVSSFSIMGIH